MRSGVSVVLQDRSLDYLFIANPFEDWRIDPKDAPDDVKLFGPILAARLAELKMAVLQTGEAGQIESAIADDRYLRFVIERIEADDGKTEVMTTIIDVTEERQRESVLRALLREVSHRSKNLLAIIQSIATQTARHSDTIEQFLLKFRGRLYSLSMSQDLITDSSWRGALFQDLVHQQLQRYAPETTNGIEVRGDDLRLTPNASLHVGLALHELIINAVTHGTLMTKDSEIVVSCQRMRAQDRDLVELVWQEELTPDGEAEAVIPVPDKDAHFGSIVLERILPASVDGTAEYEIGSHHILYRLTFPAEIQPQ